MYTLFMVCDLSVSQKLEDHATAVLYRNIRLHDALTNGPLYKKGPLEAPQTG